MIETTQHTNRAKELYLKSKEAALSCIKAFPDAQIVYRKTKNEKATWTPLPAQVILKHKANTGFFALLLNSIGLCCIDFDLESDAHPKGITQDNMTKAIKAWKLEGYKWLQYTLNGGSHYLFLKPSYKGDRKGPWDTSESNKFGQGIDYLAGKHLLCLYDCFCWCQNKKLLRPLPEQAKISANLKTEKSQPQSKSKTGYGTTNERLNSGYNSYKKVTTPYELGNTALKVAMNYLKNPGKTDLKEASQKLGQSMVDGILKNKNIKQTVIPQVDFVTEETVAPSVKWLWDNFIPYAYSVWAGPTGKGKTTTLLNALTLNALGKKMPGTDQMGDGRPFLYHGPENALATIQKRVKDCGGELNKHIFFLKMKGLDSMTIPRDYLMEYYLRALESQKFATVVCDPIYLLLKDQNKSGQDLLVLAQACLKYKQSGFVGVGHLKKSITDQEVIHHIRGDSDIVTLARSVVYMREGKEKNQRVIVPLKNSLTGDLDTGFVTTMLDDNSPLTFQHYDDNNFAILKDHGKPFNSFLDSPEDTADKGLITDIQAVFRSHGGNGKWKSEDFKTWIQDRTGKEYNKKDIQRILKKSGLIRKQTGSDYAIYDREADK